MTAGLGLGVGVAGLRKRAEVWVENPQRALVTNQSPWAGWQMAGFLGRCPTQRVAAGPQGSQREGGCESGISQLLQGWTDRQTDSCMAVSDTPGEAGSQLGAEPHSHTGPGGRVCRAGRKRRMW
jgi:hypothetical protein